MRSLFTVIAEGFLVLAFVSQTWARIHHVPVVPDIVVNGLLLSIACGVLSRCHRREQK